MAKIASILQIKFPGKSWKIEEDDFASLQFLDKDEGFKITEQEIRQYSDEVDALILEREKKQAQEVKLLRDSGSLFATVEALAISVKELQAEVLLLRPNAVFTKSIEVLALVTKVANAKTDAVDDTAEITSL